MLSAVILSERGYPAVPLAGQLVHQRFVRPGPLVLGTGFLKFLTRAADRDRTVSRRSKPSSRAALMGEQPNPWDLLQPQDATSRHRTLPRIPAGADYIFTLPRLRFWARGQRLMAVRDLSVYQRIERAISRSIEWDRSVVTGSSQETCTQIARACAGRQ